ncbi:MAG: 3,4-dihydroxy-2-butanone 4-phosphate synthase [Methanobacteriota archaeon]|nr:MAG: 3,4-dihydroxy-2-butanone 4-phosphate synthase [Euryarchaeota archaeon]
MTQYNNESRILYCFLMYKRLTLLTYGVIFGGIQFMGDRIKQAIDAFANGLPVCVFDSEFREGETDLLFSGAKITEENIRQLRKECGGLLFLAIGSEIGEMFGLPYLQDLYDEPILNETYPLLQELSTNDLQYDSKSAFTLSINHRDTYTGITDTDRCLTTKRFAELSNELLEINSDKKTAMLKLGLEFRTPGHIPVCLEQKGGIETREGHTELAVALARLANVPPVVIGAEMLQPNGDAALSVEDAKKWAEERGILFLTGDEIKQVFKERR